MQPTNPMQPTDAMKLPRLFRTASGPTVLFSLLLLLSALGFSACGGSATTADAPAETPAPALDEPAEMASREIVELHDFLLVWFRGDTEHSQEAFLRFEDALAPNFSMIGPDGTAFTREQVTTGVYADWGRWQDDPAPSIRIENTEILERDGDDILVRYEEHQSTAAGTTVRTSTVLLRAAAHAPLGYEWVDLREAWKAPAPDATQPTDSREP